VVPGLGVAPVVRQGALAVLMMLGVASASGTEPWRELEAGLELARFDTRNLQAAEQGDLVILRVDPESWELAVHSDQSQGLDAWAWCKELNLVAAVNAGMFQADHKTHVGYCKIDGRVTNKAANDYLSAAALDPIDPADPPFRIFDLDEIELGEVAARYRTVIQNLRLIKHAGRNRWQPSPDTWREVALGEDFKGRCLLIYCDSKLSMHDFNEILLALPIGLVAAQHLEGGGPAKLWIDHPAVVRGSLPGGTNPGPVLPNILGVASRHPQSAK
jgi:hypothetical protein